MNSADDRKSTRMPFVEETRSQSIALGFILVVGLAVVGLGIFQAAIVPNQNKQVEFNHASQIDSSFAELHTGIVNAVDRGGTHAQSIQLGARYPSRSLTVNAPDPGGTIRTDPFGASPSPGISTNLGSQLNGDFKSNLCGLSASTDTKAFVYTPDYNHLSGVGIHTYENSVTLQDVDGAASNPKQSLVDGNAVHLRPLVASVPSTTGTGSEVVSFSAGRTGMTTVTASSSWTLELPTRLSESQWETLLSDERVANGGQISNIDVNSGVVAITFQSGTYDLRCTPIGAAGPPSNAPTLVPGGGSIINPVGGDSLELLANDCSEMEFRNNDVNSPKKIEAIRVPYTNGAGANGDTIVFTSPSPADTDVSVTIGQSWTGVNPNDWQWTAGEVDTVQTDITGCNPNNGFTFIVRFTDGEESVYFVNE